MRDVVVMGARAALLATALLLGSGCGDDVAVPLTTVRQAESQRDLALRTCTRWVRIDVQLEGASAALVEQTIVTPIERMLETSIAPTSDGVAMASRATPGRATVWVATPVDPTGAATWRIAGAISHPGPLPAEAGAPVVVHESPWLHTVVVALGSEPDPNVAERSAGELFARLERRPGVMHVAWVGAPPLGLTVRVDPARLDALGLTVADVHAKLQSAEFSLPRRHAGGGIDPAALPELRVATRPDGTTIRLADVAAIVEERREGPPAPRLSGHAVTVLVSSGHGREPVAQALRGGSPAPGVGTTIIGSASSSTCVHPLRASSVEGGLQAIAVGMVDGGPAAYDLARRFPEGLWLFDQPDIFAGPGGTERAAQWIGAAGMVTPDLASEAGVAIVGRAAPGLQAITIAISGVDRDALRSAGETLRATLESRGDEVLADPPDRTIVTLELTEAARAAGLRVADLVEARSPSGDVPGVTTWNGRPIRFAVGDDPVTDVEAVEDVRVPLPSGGTAPLSTLAVVRSELVSDLTRLDQMPVRLVHVVTRDVARTQAKIHTALEELPLASGTIARVLK